MIDVEGEDAAESLEIKRRMEEVPRTIRTRILY